MCVNSFVDFNAITSPPEVIHKCLVWAAPEHSLEACSTGNTQTKRLGITDFKTVPATHSSQDPFTQLLLWHWHGWAANHEGRRTWGDRVQSFSESRACVERETCCIQRVGQLSCRVAHGTGTRGIVGLCGKVVNSSEVDCGPHLGLGERCCKVWWKSVGLHMGQTVELAVGKWTKDCMENYLGSSGSCRGTSGYYFCYCKHCQFFFLSFARLGSVHIAGWLRSSQ